VDTVLSGTDGSKESEDAARFIIDLPLPRLCKIFLITNLESHIAALLSMPTLNFETNRMLLMQLREDEEKAAYALLEKTGKHFTESGYEIQTIVLRGDPAEEILIAEKSINPDMIVIGAKGKSAVESFLLGSVAQRVSRFSTCSVLIVREKGKHF
jgi:nucleotide-binding universal stress UspA family protein